MLAAVRRASARAVAAAGLLTSLVGLGCRDDPTSEPLDRSEDEPAAAGTSEPIPAPPPPAPLAEPWRGIEALAPAPSTGWPLDNVDLATEAGWRIDPVSGGFELAQALSLRADAGAFVLAIAPGEVVELRELGEPGAGPALELVIAHGDGIESRYAPLSEALVHAGLPVSRGAAIGLAAGKTLELAVTVDGVAIDPLLALRQPLHRWPGLLRSLPPPEPQPDSQ